MRSEVNRSNSLSEKERPVNRFLWTLFDWLSSVSSLFPFIWTTLNFSVKLDNSQLHKFQEKKKKTCGRLYVYTTMSIIKTLDRTRFHRMNRGTSKSIISFNQGEIIELLITFTILLSHRRKSFIKSATGAEGGKRKQVTSGLYIN